MDQVRIKLLSFGGGRGRWQLSIVVSFLMVACVNNKRPGLSDKDLFSQKKVDTLLVDTKQEQILPDEDTYVVPPGVKYRESRAVDPTNPPVVLDIANRNLNIRKFDLSDYYTNVAFYKIKHPMPASEGNFLFNTEISVHCDNGSSYSKRANSKFYFNPDSIVAGDDYFGYYSYNYEGNFLNTIKTYNFPKIYDASNNKITYYESDYEVAISEASNKQNDNQPQKQYVNGYYIDNETRASYVYNRTDTASNDFLFTFSLQGDTLCRFLNYNPVYNPQRKRAPISWYPPVYMYYYDGKFTLQQSMNDTIYRMTAPNRLVPAYVINYGPFKLDIDMAEDFSNKFFPDIWKETQKYILFTYNKDRDTHNNRTNGTVKFFYSYYDKQRRQFYHFCEETTVPEQEFLIENAVPDALPFMLSYAQIEEYFIFVYYSKKRLNDMIKDISFNTLPVEQQNKIQTIHDELDESEVLIMILR